MGSDRVLWRNHEGTPYRRPPGRSDKVTTYNGNPLTCTLSGGIPLTTRKEGKYHGIPAEPSSPERYAAERADAGPRERHDQESGGRLYLCPRPVGPSGSLSGVGYRRRHLLRRRARDDQGERRSGHALR